MTIEEIRANAPDGATHYEMQNDEVFYYSKDYIGRWCWMDEYGNPWVMSLINYDSYEQELKPL